MKTTTFDRRLRLLVEHYERRQGRSRSSINNFDQRPGIFEENNYSSVHHHRSVSSTQSNASAGTITHWYLQEAHGSGITQTPLRPPQINYE